MIEEYSINENMSDLDLIFHSVSKENVVRQNIDTTNLILENLRKNTTVKGSWQKRDWKLLNHRAKRNWT